MKKTTNLIISLLLAGTLISSLVEARGTSLVVPNLSSESSDLTPEDKEFLRRIHSVHSIASITCNIVNPKNKEQVNRGRVWLPLYHFAGLSPESIKKFIKHKKLKASLEMTSKNPNKRSEDYLVQYYISKTDSKFRKYTLKKETLEEEEEGWETSVEVDLDAKTMITKFGSEEAKSKDCETRIN